MRIFRATARARPGSCRSARLRSTPMPTRRPTRSTPGRLAGASTLSDSDPVLAVAGGWPGSDADLYGHGRRQHRCDVDAGRHDHDHRDERRADDRRWGSTDTGGRRHRGFSSTSLSTSGTITFQDVDLIDTHTATSVLTSSSADADLPGYSEGTSGESSIGTFTVDAYATETTDTINTGTVGWSFTLSDSDPVLQSLAVGQVHADLHGHGCRHTGATSTQDVTITITGTNDGPMIVAGSTDTAGGVIEDFLRRVCRRAGRSRSRTLI